MSTDTPKTFQEFWNRGSMVGPYAQLESAFEAGYQASQAKQFSAGRVSVPRDKLLSEIKIIQDNLGAGGDPRNRDYLRQVCDPVIDAICDAIEHFSAAAEPAGERVGVPTDDEKNWAAFSLANGETPDGILRRAVVNIASLGPLATASAQEIARTALRAAEILSAQPTAEPPRCPKCGYTYEDCQRHLDHSLCGEPAPPKPTAEPAAQPAVGPLNCRDAGGHPTCDMCAAGHYEKCRYTTSQTAQPSDAQAGDGMCGCGDPDCHIAIGGPHTDLAGDHNK